MFDRNNFVSRSTRLPLSAAAMLLFLLTGCKTTVDDPTLTTNVKAAIAADPSISNQPVQTSVQSGVVTLTGNVSDETASFVAAQDAAKIKGVKGSCERPDGCGGRGRSYRHLTLRSGCTRGQQVTISSESVIHFHLAHSITVQTAQTASNYGPPEPGLQTR